MRFDVWAVGIQPIGEFTILRLHYPTYLCGIPTQEIIAEDPDTHGAMFVPVVLGSDKTTVSVGTGHTEYYPLYISLGNVHNNVRLDLDIS